MGCRSNVTSIAIILSIFITEQRPLPTDYLSLWPKVSRTMNKIRMFGTEYCDLPTMLLNVTTLWRPLTLNIDKRRTKRIPMLFYIFGIALTLSYFYIYVVSMAWFVFVKFPETGDIVAATVVFSLGAASQISTCKLIFMFLNKQKIRALVEACLKCNSMEVPDSRFARNIHQTLKVVKKRAITFWLIIVVNGVIYCCKPIVLPGRHMMEDSFDYFGLEPMYESPNYETAFCITTFAVLFTVYLSSSVTALLIVTTGYAEAQLFALSEQIKNLRKDAEEHIKIKSLSIVSDINYENITNDYVKKALTEIVKIHTVNIDLVQQTENIFRGAIATEFILLTIALVAELLGGLENTYIQMPFALMQVAMDCLVGQRLMDASTVFENAVYDSKWENFNNANARTVLLILQNSQKTLTLSAGGVTTLSFTSLTFVLKSIYSAYTALRSVVK